MKIMRNNRLSRRFQRGMSLVELMVGMLIGLFLVLGVGQIFVNNSTTFRMQEGMARVQEGGRYGMQRIASSIRGAGFFGCAGLGIVTPNVIATSPPSDLSPITGNTPIGGLDDAPSGNAYGAAVGTDVVTLRGAGDAGVGLTGKVTMRGANILVVNGYKQFAVNDLLLITDCATADLFKATEVSGSTTVKIKHKNTDSKNTSNKLSKPYGKDAIVLKLFTFSYFVKDTGRDNYRGEDILSLYVKDNIDDTDYELVEGVSDLQVLYGVDTDANRTADRYMDATAVGNASNWGGVVSARISLLVDSVDDALATTATSTFLGNSTSSSRRLKKEFTGLFVLRNRTL